jgi:hypothetical protein
MAINKGPDSLRVRGASFNTTGTARQAKIKDATRYGLKIVSIPNNISTFGMLISSIMSQNK